MLTFFVVKFILGVFLPIMEEHFVYYLYILSEKACANNQDRSWLLSLFRNANWLSRTCALFTRCTY